MITLTNLRKIGGSPLYKFSNQDRDSILKGEFIKEDILQKKFALNIDDITNFFKKLYFKLDVDFDRSISWISIKSRTVTLTLRYKPDETYYDNVSFGFYISIICIYNHGKEYNQSNISFSYKLINNAEVEIRADDLLEFKQKIIEWCAN